MEPDLTILFLKLLKREPDEHENETYLSQLQKKTTTIEDIEISIKDTLEYKSLSNDYYGEVSYDASKYTIDIEHINNNNYDGVLLANGKIGIKTSAVPNQVKTSIITTNYDFDKYGRYNNNVCNGFVYTNIQLFSVDTTKYPITNVHQKLNMYNATFTTTYSIISKNIQIQQQMCALNQYPYCFFSKIKIINISNNEVLVPIYHFIQNGNNIINQEYYNNTIDDCDMFSCKGYDREKEVVVATNNIYKIPIHVTYEICGYNVIDAQNACNLINFIVPAGNEIEFEIISGMMSTNDFDHPLHELTRILLNIKDIDCKTNHNKKWIEIWKTADIYTTHKYSISDEESRNANNFQRNIKYSLYNIFSIVRDDISVEINTLNLSAIDFDGDIFWNSEIFLIPVLLILRPKSAKVLLDFRFHQLENAKNLALAYGLNGSHYPYKNDIINYKDVYWNSTSPIYAFNTGLIGIHAWNYYRITIDKHWLQTKGHKILKNCASFFQGLFDDNFELKEIFNLNNNIEQNNALTRYYAINVIKYYIESCYELAYSADDTIVQLYDILKKNIVNTDDDVTIDNTILLPVHTKIIQENGNLIFYDNSDNTRLGYKFGSFSGKYLTIEKTTKYTFHITRKTFITFYDINGNILEPLSESTALQSIYGNTDGTVVLYGEFLSSFTCEKESDYIYGKQAFISEHVNTNLNNIIRSSDNEMNILETLLILTNFYSKTFINYMGTINKVDIIRDNILYYDTNLLNNDNLFNKLLQNNLESMLAQLSGFAEEKKKYIKSFDKTLQEFWNNDVSKPWNNHNYHSMMIFNIITSLASMYITGSINNQRFYIENFGIKSRTGYILPTYMNQLIITYNSKILTIVNNL